MRDSVDKKSMLMYMSSLYEALRDMEPATVEKIQTEDGIVTKTTTTVVEVCGVIVWYDMVMCGTIYE